MEYCTTAVRSKMSKIEGSLLELNNEIVVAVKFLLSLKEEAAEIVRNLNGITTPATYLQEFMNVNSFLLKYLGFLTEINCKFEILNISEKKFKSLISRSRAVASVEVSEIFTKSDSDCKFKEVLDRENILITEHLQLGNNVNTGPAKKSNKKKLKKAVTVRCVSKSTDKSTSKASEEMTAPNKSNNKSPEDMSKTANNTSCSNDYTLKKPMLDNIILKPEYFDFTYKITSDIKSDSCTKVYEAADGQKNNTNETLPVSGNSEQMSVMEMSCSKSYDSTNNFSADKIMHTGIHSAGDIPMAEVVPTRVQGSNLDVSNDSSSVRCTKEDVKAVQSSNAEEGSDDEDCIKPEKLPRTVGEEYNVNIEYIKSPSEFYVSIIAKPSSLLLELEEKLKSFTSNRSIFASKKFKNKKALLRKEIGNYALFYSKCDEVWCRVKITNWYLNFLSDFVTAFLLDYGEMKCVSVDDLCPMPDYFKKYPTFIHRCHLQGIIPFEMDKTSNAVSWEKAATEKMKTLTENSKMLKIKIASDDCFHPPTSLPVTLWLVDEGNLCVNDLLVKKKYAKWSSDQITPEAEKSGVSVAGIEKLKEWDPMREDFESYLNSYDIDMNDPAAVIYGYVGRDYDRICMQFAKTGYCFKGISCKKEHEKLDPLGLTTDQEEVYVKAFNALPNPPPKSVLNVQVTCLLKFNQFFCLAENNSLDSFEENLQSLVKYMNAAENVLDMKKLSVPPAVGQIVIACYSEDRCWYRARVLESQPERDLYTVAFVDYGNKETMPLSDIRAIEPRYLHLPFQAMHCFIFGVEKNPKAPLKTVMDFMNEKMNDGLVSIEVIANLPGEYINLLVNVFDQNGRNLGEELIEKKYAVRKEEMLISSESESVPG